MFNKINLNRQYLLIAGAILLLIAAYQLAFKRTIEAWHLYADLQKKLNATTGLAEQPGYVVRKNQNLDHILRLYKTDTVNFRSNVLENITTVAQSEDVKLSDVPSEDPSFHNSDHITERIQFEGDYFALERTLKKLQSTREIGIIRSISIKQNKKEPDVKASSTLNMDIYFNFSSN